MAPEPGCLDENTVALLLDGALGEQRRTEVGAHLDGCEACRKLVGSAARAWGGEAESQSGVGEAARAAQASSRKPLERGAAVGRYLVLDRVAAGGMGSVYAAWDPQLDRKVALKLLHPHLGAAEALIQREAQAMARLSHPNVVAVHDVGHHQDRVFVAMEFVEGETLRHRLRARPHSWREIVALFRDAGRGLQAAHEAGVVHGDFKPQNVLVGRDGRVKVTDFGLARAAPGAPWEPQGDSLRSPASPSLSPPTFSPSQSPPAGGPAGTPAYMAPEQFDGGPVDARSDVFGFCAALYEALHGQLPFEGRTPLALMDGIRRGAIRPAPGSPVPGWLDRIVRRGLRATPEQRQPSMAALLAELERDPAARRRRLLLAAAVVLALLAGALALRQRPDPLRACAGSARRLDGIWDQARRGELERAFAQSGLAYAGDSFRRVADAFDRFAAAWTAGYQAACEASVREQPADAAVWLRLACLQQQLAGAQAKSDLLAHADPKLVEDAAALAATLEDPAACARGPGPSVPPVPEPALRPAVERLRERLARLRSLVDAGRYSEAAQALPAALSDARAIHWPAVEAEALLLLAEVQSQTSQPESALETAKQAALQAQGARHDEVAARAWVLASLVAGENLSRFEQGLELERHARAAIDRLDGDDRLLARLEDAAGMRLTRAGQLTAALAQISSARAHYERAGREDRFTTWLINDEATILLLLGRQAEAETLFVRAAALKEKLLGALHPDVAISISNLGSALTLLGRTAEADVQLRRARAILDASLKPDHFLYMALETNCGDLDRARGDLPAALGHYQRAVEIGEKSGRAAHQNMRDAVSGLALTLVALGRPAEAIPLLERALPSGDQVVDPIDLADLRFGLASALASAGRDRGRARTLALQAREVYASTGRRGASTLAEVDAWLARHR